MIDPQDKALAEDKFVTDEYKADAREEQAKDAILTAIDTGAFDEFMAELGAEDGH